MRKILFILLSISTLVCIGCGNKKQVLDKPDDLIDRSTMVNIIAESYIIESTIHTSPDSIDRGTLAKLYYRDLFNRYHLTRDRFERSLNYYISEESSAEQLLSDASAAISQKRKALGIADTPAPQPDAATTPQTNAAEQPNDTKHLSPTPAAVDIQN